MAHKAAAKKHLRQTVKRTARNKSIKERIKDTMKSIQKLTLENKADEARAALPKLAKLLDKAAKRGTIHSNRASRLKSRFTKRVAALK